MSHAFEEASATFRRCHTFTRAIVNSLYHERKQVKSIRCSGSRIYERKSRRSLRRAEALMPLQEGSTASLNFLFSIPYHVLCLLLFYGTECLIRLLASCLNHSDYQEFNEKHNLRKTSSLCSRLIDTWMGLSSYLLGLMHMMFP